MSKSIVKRVKKQKEVAPTKNPLAVAVEAYQVFMNSVCHIPALKKCLEEAVRNFSQGMLWLEYGIKQADEIPKKASK